MLKADIDVRIFKLEDRVINSRIIHGDAPPRSKWRRDEKKGERVTLSLFEAGENLFFPYVMKKKSGKNFMKFREGGSTVSFFPPIFFFFGRI